MIEIRKIRGKGRGVVAVQLIHPRTIIIKDPLLIFTRDEYAAIAPFKIGDYAFSFGERRGSKRSAALALGPASLLNHSDEPNCGWRIEAEYLLVIAERLIRRNDELTIDYGWPVGMKNFRSKRA